MFQQNITQFHTVRVFVSIKTVRLLVRFPCRLSFQLKTDNGSTQTMNTYELKKGQCDINETIQLDLDIIFDNQRRCYQDKKIKLVVMMSSANGVIPAGMVLFCPCECEPLQRVEQTLSLQKCPDRSATIRLTRWYQFLRTTSNMPGIYHSTFLDNRYTLKSNNNKNNDVKHSTYTQGYGRNSKYSPAKREITPKKLQLNMNSNLPNNQNRPQTTRSHIRTNSDHMFYNQGQQDYRMAESYIEQPSYGHTASFYPMNHSAYVSNQPHHGQGHNNYSSSQKMEFGEKANYLKQIAKLRGEVKSLQNEDKWEQILKIKDENQTLIMQLEKQKDKLRNLQKKDRDYNITIKELKDQLDRTRLKVNNAETLRLQTEQNLHEKDRKLKQSQAELKKLEQKLSDLQLSVSTQQKRIQFKQGSFQQQLQKLNEKYNLSENQRQKVTFQYNTLLTKMEENEKKFQIAQKDKERFYNEEKNKLTKKIDTMTQQYEKLKEEFQEKDLAFNQLTAAHRVFTRKEAEKQAKLIQLENELELINAEHKKQEQQRKALQNEASILRAAQQQRNTLKKKHNQTLIELTKTKEKLDHVQNDYNILTSKFKDLQVSIQQLKKQRVQLNSKINSQNKEIQQLNKIHDKKVREQQALSEEQMNTNQRINDLRSKLQTEQRDYTEMVAQYDEQIAYLTKAKEYADAEVEDLKWTIQKQSEQYQQLAEKLKQSTQESLLLNKQLIKSSDKLKRTQEQLLETQSHSRALLSEKLSLQEKERLLQESLKVKTAENYELSKKILQLEQELYLFKEKLQQALAYQKDRFVADEKTLKEKDKEINLLAQQLNKVQMEVNHSKEETNELNLSLNAKINEIGNLKNANQNLNEKINDLELKNEQLKLELKNITEELNNLKLEKEDLKKDLQTVTTNNQKLTQEWQQYRTSTLSALEQLMAQISKDEESLSSKQQNLLIFPDINLSTMQVEAIKKRNNIISSYREKIAILEKQLATSKQSSQKLKQKIQEKQAQHELIITKQKQRTRQLINESNQERQSLTQQIKQNEEKNIELASEIQRLQNEIKKKEEINEETSSELKQVILQRQSLKQEIKTLEEQIIDMKSTEIRSRAKTNSRYEELNDQSQQEILKIKFSLIETQRKLLTNQKLLTERQQSIKRLEAEVTSITAQYHRTEQKVIELNEKVSTLVDEKKVLEKKQKLLEKEIKQQLQINEQTVQSLNNQKAKLEQVKSRYNQNFEELTDVQVENEKLKQELEQSNAQLSSLENSLKEKEQKHKLNEQKLSSEVKQLKEKLITLNSDLELKSFITKQLQDNISLLKQNLAEIKQEVQKKKDEIIKLGEQIQQKKTYIMQVDQSLMMSRNEKESLKEENQRLRGRINLMESQLNQNRILEEILEMKEKEVKKLKQDLQTTRRQYEKKIAGRRSISDEKTIDNNKSTTKIFKEEDYKRKIRDLEQLLETKHYDLAIQRKKWMAESEREKRHLAAENNQLTERIEDMQSEFDFQRAQLNKEIQSLGQQNDELIKILQQKQQAILTIENIAKELENGNTSRVRELKVKVEELKKIGEIQVSQNQESLDKNRQNLSFSQDSKFMGNFFSNNTNKSSHNIQISEGYLVNGVLNDEDLKEHAELQGMIEEVHSM